MKADCLSIPFLNFALFNRDPAKIAASLSKVSSASDGS